MTWRGRRAFWSGVPTVAAGLLCVVACARPQVLDTAEPIEAELAPNGRADYLLEVGREEYVRLRITPGDEESAAEISALVFAPGEQPLLESSGIRSGSGGVMAWVAESGGSHRVRVLNPYTSGAIRFRLAVEEVRPSQAGDRDRVAAQLAVAEAARLADRGEQERALEALERARDRWRQAGEPDSMVEVLLAMANLELPTKRDAALNLTDEALRVSREAGLSSWTIDALNLKGQILRRANQCPQALVAYQEALAIARGQGDVSRAGEVQYNVGTLHRSCGSPSLAATAFEAAFAIGREAGDRPLQAVCKRDLALLAKRRGDLTEAQDHIEHAWQLIDGVDDREVKAAVLHELGNLERYQGKLTQAREHYLECLHLNESLDRKDWIVDVLLSLGSLSLDLRRPDEARTHYQHALSIAEEFGAPAKVADVQRELGAVYERLNQYSRAEELYRDSLAAAEKVGSERLIAVAHFRLGHLLVKLGRAREALEHLSAARDRQRSIGEQQGLSLTLRALGSAYGRLGEERPALDHLSEALTLQQRQGNPLRVVWTLYEIAKLQEANEPMAAIETVEEAIALSQQVRSGLAIDLLRAEFSEAPRHLYELYVDLLIRQGDTVAAFAANEEGRAQALLDLLAEAQTDPRLGIDQSLYDESRAVDQRIAGLQIALRDALMVDPTGERVSRLRERLEEAIQSWWRLEAEIRQRAPRYRELQAPSIQTVEEVQATLPPEAALLEYWLGAERSYLFVVTRDRFTVLPLPPTEDVRSRIKRVRSAMVGLEPPASFAAEAHALYLDLVAPGLQAATGATELIIVPDGPLHLLPFETLVTSTAAAGDGFSDLAYLLRRASISYAPSSTVLANLDRHSASRERHGLRFLAFADPLYDRALALDCPEADSSEGRPEGAVNAGVRARNLQRLRGARREVRAIAALYGADARVYEGAEATEERVTADPEVAAAARLHFAVHGVICETRPERSGLVLALHDEPVDDGVLSTREIFGLNLTADLVVLSACDTGVGKIVWGEGVVGLSRAFFYAGAPSLVVSLWPVSDRSTAGLMASFYRRLDEGEDKAEALRHAKLELLAPNGRSAAPFYWAPFVLIGRRDANAAPSTG